MRVAITSVGVDLDTASLVASWTPSHRREVLSTLDPTWASAMPVGWVALGSTAFATRLRDLHALRLERAGDEGRVNVYVDSAALWRRVLPVLQALWDSGFRAWRFAQQTPSGLGARGRHMVLGAPTVPPGLRAVLYLGPLVELRADGVVLSLRGQVTTVACVSAPDAPLRYDLAAVTRSAAALHAATDADNHTVRVRAHPGVPFGQVLGVLDALRESRAGACVEPQGEAREDYSAPECLYPWVHVLSDERATRSRVKTRAPGRSSRG